MCKNYTFKRVTFEIGKHDDEESHKFVMYIDFVKTIFKLLDTFVRKDKLFLKLSYLQVTL